jgi:hypothetical protein
VEEKKDSKWWTLNRGRKDSSKDQSKKEKTLGRSKCKLTYLSVL